jgi:hypothetical protein
MVHMYCDRPFDELKTAAKAALEHHFNNHDFCGGWCPYLVKSEAERAEVQFISTEAKQRIACYINSASKSTRLTQRNKGCVS